MSKGHVPTRMCSICRKRQPKVELNRFTLPFEGAYPVSDQKQKNSGRGMYVCAENACLESFHRRWQKKVKKG